MSIVNKIKLPDNTVVDINDARFSSIDSTPIQNSTNPINGGAVYTALNDKEDNSNKVTSISSSSTDDQYPSAKCVYDQLDAKLSVEQYEEDEEVIAASLNDLNSRLNDKQPLLVSGTNIKTINNTSLLGSGNITINADTSACEMLTNKVTSLSSSSTDTQYPSAKCMYDLIGDIDTTLNAILAM